MSIWLQKNSVKIVRITPEINRIKAKYFGDKETIAEKTKNELEKSFLKINIVGTCNGYVDENIAIENINKSGANILFVGLGSPKQEEFIIKNRDKLPNVKIFMPVGRKF